jgi:YidC/Oxa1 family membrane protein insertase
VLDFLYTAVSWVLLRWHQLFTAMGLDAAGGLNWALSIIFLVITARLLLFRLFVKQVKYQRHMQQMQPRLQKIREKYKDDRAAQQREMMKLQQEEGFNPLAGCLPLFLQFPIFIALYHVLRHIANVGARGQANVPSAYTLYGFTHTQTVDAAQARLFGGAPLAGRLLDTNQLLQTLHGTRGTRPPPCSG